MLQLNLLPLRSHRALLKRVFPVLLLLLAPLSRAESAPRLDGPYHGDRLRNNDGSYRYSLEVAGDLALPAGVTKRYQNMGAGFRIGGGYNLSRRVGAMMEYDFNDFGIPRNLLNQLPYTGQNAYSGQVHLWSLTANPVVHLHRGEDGEAYVVGGGGFYRKLAKFQATDYCASSGTGCLNFPSIFLHESNNAGGANLGFGAAKRLVQDSKVRVFVEGRYVWIANTGVHGPGVYAIANTRTGYFPVLLGLKW